MERGKKIMYDVIIIGAGPAGISASLYVRRANLKVAVFYKNESSLEKTKKIENYYGFCDGIDGEKLYLEGISQAKKLGVEIKKEEVNKIIENGENRFKVITEKENYEAKTVILATGISKKKPQIKGIEEFEGRGISYCAVCDGFFFRNRSVAVLGNGSYAISEINDLINIVKDITILTNGEKELNFRADNVITQTKKIKEIRGENRVEEIEFEDGTKIKTDGIFVAQGVAGSIDFAKKLGIITKKDDIIVNENMETNIKGVYACGDCTGGLLQISKSVYEGTKAGLSAVKHIRNIDKINNI